MIDDVYTFGELINKLESIKEGQSEDLNIPDALLSICYEIDKINRILRMFRRST
jgi:hypothetical protein